MPWKIASHRNQTLARPQPENRPSAAKRGYNRDWREYRLGYLASHPLCVRCLEQDKLVPAMIVDHIMPHKGNPELFWNPENHQSLCEQCHNRKTATEDGGFGRMLA